LLRILLGGYTGRPPGELCFTYGENGKPALAESGPWFNLSHSGPLALLGFSAAAEVGIDVELYDEELAGPGVAERFFSPSEVRRLRALASEIWPSAFLRCWTRKEAFIKARGDGLSLPLDSFDVSVEPAEPAALLRTAWSREEPARWQLADLSDDDAGFVAAIASRRTGWSVVSRRIAAVAPDGTVIEEDTA
jgi:4'-phosphopantetheinyl transferase